MSGLQIVAGSALTTAALALLARAVLLGRRGRGWPHAPWTVRAGLFLLAFALSSRSMEVLGGGRPAGGTEATLYVALAVYAVVLAFNLACQRSPRAAVAGGMAARPETGRTKSDPLEPPAWPGASI